MRGQRPANAGPAFPRRPRRLQCRERGGVGVPWKGALAITLLLLASLAGPATAREVLVLDGSRQTVPLTPQLQYRVDPDGRADASAMFEQARADGFEPLRGGDSTF